ncbi:MAG: hypothetical protein LUE24_03545 [Lachnospiraceae bacterium]|nr:hypothetical protein [Lachnospiraceae bacterium]
MMKKTVIFMTLLLLIGTLSACGSSDKESASASAPETQEESEAENTAAEEEAEAESSDEEEVFQIETESDEQEDAADSSDFDIDLTELSSTMVYAEVYNMMYTPDEYLGKSVRMSGTFTVYEGEDRNYYACIIEDATACCSQGIEFVLDGDFSYPDDYPDIDSTITVSGIFDTYYEGQSRYAQLIDAELE